MQAEQLDLIERPAQLTRAQARRQAMAAARIRAERGMSQAESSAEWSNPGWIADTLEKLRMFARNQGGVWSIEMAREALKDQVPTPPDLRSWGRVTQLAHAAGYIEPAPRTFVPAASSNSTLKPAWRRGKRA